MTTADNTAVVVEANGFIRVCAWCLSAKRLAELTQQYRCTHSLCPDCTLRLQEETA